MKEVTQEKLKELFRYAPDTGVFTRLVSVASMARAGDIAGNTDGQGYLRIRVEGKLYKAHRLAWLYTNGEFPQDQIDHINGVRDDNRIANLRAVNRTENMKNTKIRTDNTSGVLGVGWHKGTDKWLATINVKGVKKYLGYFTDIKDAVAARKKANILYGYHENHGRSL